MGFKDEPRYYEIEGVGKLPSVTTILKAMAKPGLYKWYENQGTKKAFEILDKISVMSPFIHQAILKQLPTGFMKAGSDMRDDAAKKGTLAHSVIEKLTKGEKVDLTTYADEVQNAVGQFKKWRDKHDIEFIKSEAVVHSEIHRYAGTMDALIRLDGVVTLADYKTSKGIFPEYHMQGIAYKKAVEEMTGEQVPDVLILRFGKDGSFDDAIVPPEEHDEIFDTFIHLMPVWKWMMKVKILGG